jgi:hypothetical protein
MAGELLRINKWSTAYPKNRSNYALVLSEFSHTDFTIINNNKAISPGFGGNVYYEPIHRTPGLFYSCRPSVKAYNFIKIFRTSSGTRDNLLHVYNGRGIFQCCLDHFQSQFWISLHNSIHGVSTSHHAKYVFNHNSSTLDNRFSRKGHNG